MTPTQSISAPEPTETHHSDGGACLAVIIPMFLLGCGALALLKARGGSLSIGATCVTLSVDAPVDSR